MRGRSRSRPPGRPAPAELNRTSFDRARLIGTYFSWAKLTYTRFDNATLIDAHFDWSTLTKVSFAYAVLTRTPFDRARRIDTVSPPLPQPGSGR
ncbi:pentapeptide repeat-containing protein (plasmid) [Streptosporangium sp. CA-135522]|uniref:pentapeptide repeat-containing protein n=1 Tax=Streptosporangium sp. CA-135522 TaxID=3240072 RepID=UPI003D8BAF16